MKKYKQQKYDEFIRKGGGKSGVYDITDKRTRAFVKEYKEFIPKREIYRRNKKGYLVPVYKGENIMRTIKKIGVILACVALLAALVALLGVATEGFTSFKNASIREPNPDNLITLDNYKVVEIEDDKETGYTIAINDDGVITIKGENEAEEAVKIAVQDVVLEADKEYTLSSGAKTSNKTYFVTVENADGSVEFEEETFEVETAGTYTVYITIKGETEINETFELVLIEGDKAGSFYTVK